MVFSNKKYNKRIENVNESFSYMFNKDTKDMG